MDSKRFILLITITLLFFLAFMNSAMVQGIMTVPVLFQGLLIPIALTMIYFLIKKPQKAALNKKRGRKK